MKETDPAAAKVSLAEEVHARTGWRWYRDLPDSGLWHLCLADAALLVTLDLWYQGQIHDPDGSVIENDDPNGPELRAALRPVLDDILSRLVRAVENNQLQAVIRRRSWEDERIHSEASFITYEALRTWVEGYGWEWGKYAEEFEADMRRHHVEWAEGIAFMRFIWRHSAVAPKDLLDSSMKALQGDDTIDGLKTALASATAHVTLLRRELAEREVRPASAPLDRVSSPPTTRQKRTYLRVIAALCKQARIDPSSRGVAKIISLASDEAGGHVDDQTIRNILTEIPQALDDGVGERNS